MVKKVRSQKTSQNQKKDPPIHLWGGVLFSRRPPQAKFLRKVTLNWQKFHYFWPFFQALKLLAINGQKWQNRSQIRPSMVHSSHIVQIRPQLATPVTYLSLRYHIAIKSKQRRRMVGSNEVTNGTYACHKQFAKRLQILFLSFSQRFANKKAFASFICELIL